MPKNAYADQQNIYKKNHFKLTEVVSVGKKPQQTTNTFFFISRSCSILEIYLDLKKKPQPINYKRMIKL